MQLPLVSIIIPVYNAQEYIVRCLDSVLVQTYGNMEIICIDDGSKDRSASILSKYAQQYAEKVKIYSQSNSGVATARNNGLMYAKGQYVFFIDNDDYIAVDYIQKHVEAIEFTGGDMVISGYKRVDETGRCIFHDKTKPSLFWEPFKRLAPWGRVYRSEFIKKNCLYFLDNMIGEDDYFNIIAACKTDRISVLNYVGYFWFFNTQSISNTQHVDLRLEKSAVYLLDMIHTNLDDESLGTKRDYIEYVFIKFSVWFILFFGNKMPYERLYQTYMNLFETVRKYYPNYKHNRLIGALTPKGEYYKTRISVVFFMLLEKFKMTRLFIKLYSNSD